MGNLYKNIKNYSMISSHKNIVPCCLNPNKYTIVYMLFLVSTLSLSLHIECLHKFDVYFPQQVKNLDRGGGFDIMNIGKTSIVNK